jgi:Kef-type K+ transport system membrane component KefB
MEHGQISYMPLLIVLGLAFVIPILLAPLKRITIPIVIGEIIAGMVVGPAGLGLVTETPLLEILSILGFTYLMFLSGLEIDFSRILSPAGCEGQSLWQRARSNSLVIGFVTFGVTMVLAVGAALLLQWFGFIDNLWIMALILVTTSLGVVMPVLKDVGISGTRYGQFILVATVVADFTSILLISVYVTLRSQGLSADILLVLVLLAAFVSVYRLAEMFRESLPAKRFFDKLSTATSQIRLRGVFALLLTFIVLAETVGTEYILGAFLAGVIVSLLSGQEGSVVREKLEAIGYGFFIPIFFIMIGVGFNLRALLATPGNLLLVPLLVVIAYVVKLAGALPLRLALSWRRVFAAGMVLSSRLSLIIAAAAIGLNMGLISEAMNSAIILIAAITCTVSPIVFSLITPREKAQRSLVILVGNARFPEVLAQRLREHDVETRIIRDTGPRDSEPRPEGFPSLMVRDQIVKRLREAGVEQARAVVAMEARDEDNLRICRLVRLLFNIDNIVAWVQDPSKNSDFRRLGVRVVNPFYSSVLILENMVLNRQAFSMTPDIDQTLEVRNLKLKQVTDPRFIGRRLDDIRLPGNTTVLAIDRMGERLVPDSETILRPNDTLTLVGTHTDLDNAFEMLQAQ